MCIRDSCYRLSRVSWALAQISCTAGDLKFRSFVFSDRTKLRAVGKSQKLQLRARSTLVLLQKRSEISFWRSLNEFVNNHISALGKCCSLKFWRTVSTNLLKPHPTGDRDFPKYILTMEINKVQVFDKFLAPRRFVLDSKQSRRRPLPTIILYFIFLHLCEHH